MSEGTSLTEAREELRRQLTDGEYKPVIDVLLDMMGRFLQKLTRRAKPPVFWYSILFITLLTQLYGLLVLIILGRLDRVIIVIITGVIIFATLFLLKWIMDRTFANLGNGFLDAIDTTADLTDLRRWLILACDRVKCTLVSLLYLVFVILLGYFLQLGPVGPSVLELIFLFLVAGMWVYHIFLFYALPLRISRYNFKLHIEDPSSSEVVALLSALFNDVAYVFALLMTLGTLGLAFGGALNVQVSVIILVGGWLPTIVLFVMSQYALSRIIIRGKWKSLNEVQAEMAAVRANGSRADKETIEAIMRLWDYHDRIKRGRNSAINFGRILSLLYALLLPLLGLILGDIARRLLALWDFP